MQTEYTMILFPTMQCSQKKVCKYDMQNNHNDSVEYSYVKCLVLYTEF